MQNFKYPPAFDDWTHELAIIRPEAYRNFQSVFGGRSERSFQNIRSGKPSFTQGITDQTVQRASHYLKDYGYPLDGPLVTGVDDTKLLPTFRPYYDGSQKKWFLVGGTGDPMEVADINTIQSQIDKAQDLKATKLRLWTLSIPLPGVPPLILAASPIPSKINAIELARMEEKLLSLLIHSKENFNIISLGSDGTTVEREARRELIRSNFAESTTYRIPHPNSECSPIIIELYKVDNRIMVPIQDSKHCHKTAHNNIFTGARIITLGRHVVCYEQVRDVAFSTKESPLYVRDVHKLDRQDDRAAARLFSASTLEFLIENNPENLGLIVYLFVFGELVDAYQSRTMSHLERVKVALRAQFFKDQWKKFLKDAGYAPGRHFISNEASDIIYIMVNGIIGLVYIHHDILKRRFPLLPWRNGSETNEHVFGFIRDLVPDFTMLDVLRLVPKLGVRLMAACKRKNKADFRRAAAGYSHTYSEANDADMHFLTIFPTDAEIASASQTAFDESTMLWELLGYYPTSSPAADIPSPIENDVELSDEEDNVDDDEISDRRELQNALDAAAVMQASGLPTNQVDETLDQCGFAVAALNLTELEKM